MEKNLITPVFKLKIDGEDLTEDLSGFTVGMSYRDTVEASSDSLDVLLTAQDDRFAGDWYPPKGSTLEVLMGYPGDVVSTGVFVIDEVEYSGMPYQLSIRSIAAIVTKGLRTKRSTSYEDVTLADIVTDVARRHKMQTLGRVDTSLTLPRCLQNKETDMSFLARLAETYGYAFSVRNESIYFNDIYDLEATEPTLTISLTEVSSFTFRDETMKVKRAAKTRYVNTDSQDSGEGISERPQYRTRAYIPSPLNPNNINTFAAQNVTLYYEEIDYDNPVEEQTGTQETRSITDGVSGQFNTREGFLTPLSIETNTLFGRNFVEREPIPPPEPTLPNPITRAPAPFVNTSRTLTFDSNLSIIAHKPPEVNGTDADEDVEYGGARSEAEAAAMAKARNHKNTTGQLTGTLNLQGRPTLLAGTTILLSGFGKQWDGKYIIVESVHDMAAGTYNTSISIKKI